MIMVGLTIWLVLLMLLAKNIQLTDSLQTRTSELQAQVEQLQEEAKTQNEEKGKKEVQETEQETEVQETETGTEAETEEQTEQETVQETESTSINLDQILAETTDVGGTWAISVMDLTTGSSSQINADYQMQSASVIKVFIMGAVYDRICYPADDASAIYVEESYDGELRDLLYNMITVSDNDAANQLVELLGYGDFETGKAVVNAFCQEHGYTGTHLGRRFLAENPSDDNYTTAADCCQILSDIYYGTCVGREASAKMITLLQNQTVKTKIPAGLPSGISSANKTGEMPEGYGLGCIENDIAIVYGETKDYVLCVLSNDLNGNNEGAKSRIAEISGKVYGEME
jgi:N-acetylmuramoyl-L-alanine amidase